MKVEFKDLSPVKKRMSIEVDPDVVERETEGVLLTYRKKARIPGFRPGKAPLDLIRTRFAREVHEDVRERIVSRLFIRAAEERGLQPLGEPLLDELTHEAGRPFSFQTTFEVLPRIELRGLQGIEVRRTRPRISDEEVAKAIEQLRQGQARYVVEADRQAGDGDIVVADIEGQPSGGAPFRRERMPIEVGAANNLPAFNEHLKGVRPGVSVEFRVEYPPKYGARSLAGKAVAYTIRVHEVKRRDVPDLDDELARGLGEADLGSLRERVRAKLLAHREQEGERETRQALLDKVLIENPVALPDVLVEREIRRRLEQIVQSVILQGVDPGKAELDWKELRKRQEEPARKAVHARLILDAVGQAQKLQVAPDEVDARIREEAHRVGEAPEKLRARLREHGGMEGLTGQLVREKSLDYLTSVANIQYSE